MWWVNTEDEGWRRTNFNRLCNRTRNVSIERLNRVRAQLTIESSIGLQLTESRERETQIEIRVRAVQSDFDRASIDNRELTITAETRIGEQRELEERRSVSARPEGRSRESSVLHPSESTATTVGVRSEQRRRRVGVGSPWRLEWSRARGCLRLV
ncbi:hypothetical protein CRG98_044112 [Punica granatum]|uniref:Uncharacterized protein n=1 Tax=Punica granatum TaxID=22663 RepID=A0A2I0HUV8_PUNGR|nr:hypothetical protein CRG98_044112 [Punica granatum]